MFKTITPAYREICQQMHQKEGYGSGGWRHGKEVVDLADKVAAKTVLDYGAGKQALEKHLLHQYPGRFDDIQSYDPGVPEISRAPLPADLVVCTDVLEHIEPECLDDTLAHLCYLTRKAGYLVIATFEARHNFLPDGRQAHLIVEGAPFWKDKVEKFFKIGRTHYDAHNEHLEHIIYHVYPL